MRPEDGSLPGRRMAQEGLARVRQAVRSASLPVKILLVLAILIIIVLAAGLGPRFWDLFVVAGLVYGPVARGSFPPPPRGGGGFPGFRLRSRAVWDFCSGGFRGSHTTSSTGSNLSATTTGPI